MIGWLESSMNQIKAVIMPYLIAQTMPLRDAFFDNFLFDLTCHVIWYAHDHIGNFIYLACYIIWRVAQVSQPKNIRRHWRLKSFYLLKSLPNKS